MSSSAIDGCVFYTDGQYSKASEAFSAALLSDPNNGVHYVRRASCAMMLGDWEEALQDINSALGLFLREGGKK